MSGSSKTTPKFELLIDGSPADAAVVESVIVIQAKQHLNMADVLEVRLSNPDLAWSESDAFAEGKKLAVKLGYEETGIEQVVEGEIVRRDCEFPVRGPAIVTVVAYDREHRLKRGVHSRTFVDQKDSDIVSTLASEAGLSAEVDDTAVTHKYVFQNAQTNLAFIRERALLYNYEVQVDTTNAKLYFRKGKTAEGTVADLKWGVDLLAFSPRMSTDEQVSKVVVRGWDMAQKVKIEGTAQKTDIAYKLDGTKTGAKIAEDTFGAREVLFTDVPVLQAGEATAIAKARLNSKAMRFCEGEATCQGNNAIVPGVKVGVEGCGKRANGKYYVVQTTHHFLPASGYVTVFGFVKAAEQTATETPPPPPASPPPPDSTPPEKENFVEIKITSEAGMSLEGISYTVTLPNGETQQGTLDASGLIKVEGIRDPGDAKISFDPPEGARSPEG